MDSLLAAQSNHEKRFNCIICMEAKLDMVFGLCQHRLCSSCLYLESGLLKPGMHKCPVCGKLSFPSVRPDIPEDNIEMMKCLGVRECPNKAEGCKVQFWDWEVEEHLSVCPFEITHKPVPMSSNSGVKGKLVNISSQLQARYKTRSKKNGKTQDLANPPRRSPRISSQSYLPH